MKSFDDLLQDYMAGKISALKFLCGTSMKEDYDQWLSVVGLKASNKTALMYLESMDVDLMDGQFEEVEDEIWED